MFLVVGLGNPGKKYNHTRHNIGFNVVDILAEKEKWKNSKKGECKYIQKQINNKDVELIKPMTFMNNSGRSVRYAQKKHNIQTEKIFIIHDDIDLPVSTIRISKNSSSAGHKGVQSIIQELGTKEFIRIRIGIRTKENLIAGRPKLPTEKFVLKKFSLQEKLLIKKSITLAIQSISLAIEKNISYAMAEYN